MSETTAKGQGTMNRGAFSSMEAAQLVKPDNDHFRLFRVTDPAGAVSFTWARDYDRAIAQVARTRGYKAKTAGKAPTREELAGMVAQLSPEDRAVLLAQLGSPSAATGSTAPVPEKPSGKKSTK
jgi:hypothetical protein